jgi:hypothetical protein
MINLAAEDFAARLAAATADFAALSGRLHDLFVAVEHADLRNRDEARALVAALGDVRERLGWAETPLRRAVWHSEHLDAMPVTGTD